MPRLRTLTTAYRCPVCGQGVRYERGAALKCGRHATDAEGRYLGKDAEVVMEDLGPDQDRSLRPLSTQVWMA